MITLQRTGANPGPRTRINLLHDSLTPFNVESFVEAMRAKGLDPEDFDIGVRTRADDFALEKVCPGYEFMTADDDIALKLAQGWKPTILEMTDSYKPGVDFARHDFSTRGQTRLATCPNPASPPEEAPESTKWIEVDGRRYKVGRSGEVRVKVAASGKRGPYLKTLTELSPVAARVRRASKWFI